MHMVEYDALFNLCYFLFVHFRFNGDGFRDNSLGKPADAGWYNLSLEKPVNLVSV